MAQEPQNDVDKVYDLLKNIRFLMLTTVGADGHLHSRPMSCVETERNGQLWFFTYDNTKKTDEVNRDERVNAAYAHPDRNLYLSIAGHARVVHDKAKMQQLWQPQLKAWFPKELDEPGIALLSLDMEHVEYWDGTSSRMVQLFEMVKAAITGTVAQPGEHGEVKMK